MSRSTPVAARGARAQRAIEKQLQACDNLAQRLEFLYEHERDTDGKRFPLGTIAEWVAEASGESFTKQGLAMLKNGDRRSTTNARLWALAQFYRVDPSDLEPEWQGASGDVSSLSKQDRELAKKMHKVGLTGVSARDLTGEFGDISPARKKEFGALLDAIAADQRGHESSSSDSQRSAAAQPKFTPPNPPAQ